ncbi:hypothetical protein HPB50_016754 [Hyalomma asiaticum]|uniref:Uncharacterized protein n=1 Tax=Hyalomma asiaticum TaxID=266040 RepID=A0ACB7SHQ6_HYAAI|nr:hypothetical protein HPB50_016754 [Hyalomma asiaticum]
MDETTTDMPAIGTQGADPPAVILAAESCSLVYPRRGHLNASAHYFATGEIPPRCLRTLNGGGCGVLRRRGRAP